MFGLVFMSRDFELQAIIATWGNHYGGVNCSPTWG